MGLIAVEYDRVALSGSYMLALLDISKGTVDYMRYKQAVIGVPYQMIIFITVKMPCTYGIKIYFFAVCDGEEKYTSDFFNTPVSLHFIIITLLIGFLNYLIDFRNKNHKFYCTI